MDYVSLEENYSGKIKAEIMTETHIRRAIDACETYGTAMYPSEYRDTLQTALRNSNGIDGCEIQIIQK